MISAELGQVTITTHSKLHVHVTKATEAEMKQDKVTPQPLRSG